LTLVAEVIRNGFVESIHHGRVIAVDGTGAVLVSIGDIAAPILPRSALKPMQALAMLDAGWHPKDDEQVALACASHSGEQEHVAVVRRILAEAGVDVDALDNTPSLPLDEAASLAMIRAGQEPDRLHHNCSGKHAAMLATCAANGWALADYRDPRHPLQQRIRRSIEDVAGESVAAVAVDGCGAPAFAVTLASVARAFVRLVSAPAGTNHRRVADAMRSHPFLVGGSGRDVTTLMTQVEGLLVKDGAEGVAAAATPTGVGLALKIDDGGGRARTPVLVDVLNAFCPDMANVSSLANAPLFAHGEQVGQIRASIPRTDEISP